MIKRTLTLCIFLLLFVQVALAGYLYLDARSDNAQRQWQIDPQSIERIQVNTRSVNYEFRKIDSLWYAVKNGTQATTASDTDRVEAILTLLSAPADGGYSVADVNLEATGLNDPAATLNLTGFIVDFGSATDDQQRRYIRIADRVYLINELVFPLLNTGPAAFKAQ